MYAFLCFLFSREAQRFVDKFEGALGKGKGKQFYAYKVMMMKVRLISYCFYSMAMTLSLYSFKQ